MFSKVLLCCLFSFVACDDVVEHPPQPYSFSYDNTDEFGTRVTRQETGDEHNNKVGSYSYVDPNGITRAATYVADALGFRVNIETNEPGTKTSAPAGVSIVSSAVEAPVPVVVKADPAVVKTVHPDPVVVKAVDLAPVPVDTVPTTPVVQPVPVPYTHPATPFTYAQYPGPVTYAHHPAPFVYTRPVAPVVYAHRDSPVVYAQHGAPVTYTTDGI